jgi:calcineurin-like phosphoesterase family protein
MVDWHDNWIEEAEHMNVYLISDTHFNHEKLKTHCKRPADFTELIMKRWNETVKPDDIVFHLGDVLIGHKRDVKKILDQLNGRKGLVRGNHDRDKSCPWWMENGFDFACDSFVFRNVLLTHEPANAVIKSDGNRPYDMLEETLPEGCVLNVHGHLHNVWDGFIDEKRWQRDKELLGVDFKTQLRYPWQRLFAVEYTDYRPVEFNKFIAHPERFQATGPCKVYKVCDVHKKFPQASTTFPCGCKTKEQENG